MGSFNNNEDGEKVQALAGLLGFALVRVQAARVHAKELKTVTMFLDFPVAITSFFEWSSDHPDYVIEDGAVEWRPNAAAYFKKAKVETSKDTAGTEKLVEEAETSDETKLPVKTGKHPWKWTERLKDYKSNHGPKIGGNRHITELSRKKATNAFDKKDPLADVSEKDLKESNLDFA